MTQQEIQNKKVMKRTKEGKEIYKLKKELNYYLELNNKGQVIHDYIKEGHTTAVKLFYKIMEELPKDYRFSKDDKKQQRDIKKYNYEVNFQKYCGALAREYKKLTGYNPQKFKRYIDYEKEEKEEYIRDHIENTEQEEAMDNSENDNSIADKTKNTGGSCMYPKKFKDKNNKTILIINLARGLLNENPPNTWEDDIIRLDSKEVITCKCGCEIQRRAFRKHLETNKHKRLMK